MPWCVCCQVGLKAQKAGPSNHMVSTDSSQQREVNCLAESKSRQRSTSVPQMPLPMQNSCRALFAPSLSDAFRGYPYTWTLSLVTQTGGRYLWNKWEPVWPTGIYAPDLGVLNFIKQKLLGIKAQINTIIVVDFNSLFSQIGHPGKKESTKKFHN
jgi:hypothetical protein